RVRPPARPELELNKYAIVMVRLNVQEISILLIAIQPKLHTHSQPHGVKFQRGPNRHLSTAAARTTMHGSDFWRLWRSGAPKTPARPVQPHSLRRGRHARTERGGGVRAHRDVAGRFPRQRAPGSGEILPAQGRRTVLADLCRR